MCHKVLNVMVIPLHFWLLSTVILINYILRALDPSLGSGGDGLQSNLDFTVNLAEKLKILLPHSKSGSQSGRSGMMSTEQSPSANKVGVAVVRWTPGDGHFWNIRGWWVIADLVAVTRKFQLTVGRFCCKIHNWGCHLLRLPTRCHQKLAPHGRNAKGFVYLQSWQHVLKGPCWKLLC